MLYKVDHMFWDQNESTGYRHVDVQYNDRILMAVTAHRTSGEWKSLVIPMGFSFEQNEVQAFSDMFSVLPNLMGFMCTDALTVEEMQNYLLTIQ
jgi:hypothetical protein